MSFGFPKLIPACSLLHLSCATSPSFHIPYISFWFLNLFKRLMYIHVHPCWFLATSAWYSGHGGNGYDELDSWKTTNSPGPLFSPQLSPTGLLQADPWIGQNLLSKIPSCDPTFCLVPFSLDPELRCLLISGAKAFPDLSMSHNDFIVCRYQRS